MEGRREGLRLRKATMEDAKMLLDWRNDPETRANSFQKDNVSWEEHITYLRTTLADEQTALFVAEVGNEAVGTGRVVFRQKRYSLSWTVAPQHRGQGVGKRLLAAMIALLPDGVEFEAEVLENNEASRRMAESAGMTVDYIENGIVYYKGVRNAP